jgi:ABC-type branched-subunit amino acid transport system substrate-binding protein
VVRLALPVRALVLASSLVPLGGGCAPVQGGPDDAPGPVSAGPAIEGSATTADPVADALLRQARRALSDREYADAREAANEVVVEHPRAPGSSEALWIVAQAAYELGGFEESIEASRLFRSLLDAQNPRRTEASVLTARALAQEGASDTAVLALLEIDGPAGSDALRDARALTHEAVRRVSTDRIGELLAQASGASPVLPIVRLEYAVGLYFEGRVDEAASIAREVLQQDLESSDRRVAQSLVTGNVEDVVGTGVTLGAILPATGSPTLRSYARDIEDGMRVALDARARDLRRPVQLEVLDDGGREEGSQRSIRSLEEAGVVAVVGPLMEGPLRAAAQARSDDLTILSPTAESVPDGRGLFSLGSADPGAAEALAEYATDSGLRRVAVVYADSERGRQEATAFVDAYTERGGTTRRFAYAPGSTDFREQLEAVVQFEADGLVLPVPQSDVELIAPQVSFFALDSLGVQVLGTTEWTAPEVLDRVDPRHLNGVVVASSRDPVGGRPAYDQFVRRYEALLRKTLRSPIPAFGYDAALLLLEAIDRGARTPRAVVRELEGISDFPAATGRISFRDGQIVRRHYLYEIRDRQLLPLGRDIR